jgi:hypothetical protein
MTTKKIVSILLFSNGNIAVFDQNGQQVPKLQKNPICERIKKSRKLGYNVDDAEILLPCGKAKVLKGYDNYQVVA